ncbi:MAG: sugar phosphate isomerase/epimerase family protein [Coraliomargaritaceae bacterium]
MIVSGFSDEAGQALETQIQATQELGWNSISARSIYGQNIHDLSEDLFESVAQSLDESGIRVYEFGSLIGSWSKPIESDFSITLEEVERAIPRMQRLGTNLVRIMSYGQKPWGENQEDTERFRRLREVVQRFSDAGLTAAHENCMNWGGFSAEHTLRLIDEVPGLQLIFDTGNPVFQRDRSKPTTYPWQDPLEFYHKVKDHILHVHIKDCLNPPPGGDEPESYTFPGEGSAKLREILRELLKNGYNGGFAIEPHVASVFHAKDNSNVDEKQCFESYVRYGRHFEELFNEVQSEI